MTDYPPDYSPDYTDATDSVDDPGTRRELTHPLSVGYLVVGLVFLGVAAVWALRAADVLDAGTLGWLVPAVLMAAGALGLVGSITKERSRRHRQADPGLDDGYDR